MYAEQLQDVEAAYLFVRAGRSQLLWAEDFLLHDCIVLSVRDKYKCLWVLHIGTICRNRPICSNV